MYSFYLSPELQSIITIGQRIIFSFSCLFNLTAFVCLIKETPEKQSKFRFYLCYIQILAAMNDLNLGVLFEVFPLFPVFGAFCDGVLCRLGVPIQYSFAVTVLIIGSIGASIIICFFYRHQSIVRSGFSFSQASPKTRYSTTFKFLQFFLVVLYSLPGLVILSVDFDYNQTEHLIDNLSYGNLSWIRDRGMYAVFAKTSGLMMIPIVTLAVLLIALLLLSLMVLQIALNFSKETIRSERITRRNKHALHVLLFQLVVPVLLLIVPATVMMLGILLENLIPFEMCLFSYQVLTLHTTTHSVVLLTITPAYRQFIRNIIQRLLPPMFRNQTKIATSSDVYNLELR